MSTPLAQLASLVDRYESISRIIGCELSPAVIERWEDRTCTIRAGTMKIIDIYNGSDAGQTRALYAKLATMGPAGLVALNLFRACKCSERAKVYRQRSHTADAYERKQWSIDFVCGRLIESAEALGIVWGWKKDPEQAIHDQVLYVELPTGQVSFHTDRRFEGPNFPGEWDQQRGVSSDRIIAYCVQILGADQI